MNSEESIKLTFGLGHCLHRASQQADDVFAARASHIELTARQLTVLEIVSQVERPSQMDICLHSGIDRSTVADMVLRLMKKGYVERRRSRSDARRYALQLTDEGRRVLDVARPIAREVELSVAQALPSFDLAQFLVDLKGVTQALRN